LDFSQTKIPLSIVATDLVSGQPVVFSQGKLAPAVHASISVPVVFKPVKFKNKLLVDGGLSDPVPVDLVKKMGADIVIAVNLYHQNEFNEKKFTMPTVALRSTRIALHNLAKIAVRKADIVLYPDTSDLIRATKINKYFDSIGTKKLIAVGARETFKHLPEIKKLLGDFS